MLSLDFGLLYGGAIGGKMSMPSSMDAGFAGALEEASGGNL